MLKQLPDEILIAMGFSLTEKAWTHGKANGIQFYQVLTPETVAEILFNLGQKTFQERVVRIVGEIDVEEEEERFDP